MARRRRESGTSEWIRSSADRVAECLDVPTVKVDRPVLVMMSGLPGTGKSYVADLLLTRLQAVLIRTDEVRKLLFPRPTYMSWESGVVYKTSHELIRRYLLEGKNVIFDGTNLTRSGRKQLRLIADELGARLAVVVTMAPEDVIMERLARREAGLAHDRESDADWSVYLRLKSRSQLVRGDHWRIDTSKDVRPVLDRLIEEIVEGDSGD